MLEKPDLADEVIRASLRERYGLPVSDLVFLPIGNESNTWVYHAHAADSAGYFVKLKKLSGTVYEPSVRIPRYLHDHGIAAVVAPIRSRPGALWVEIAPYVLAVYPFIEGGTGMEIGLTPPQWTAFGRILHAIHTTALPPELAAITGRESFTLKPRWMQVIGTAQTMFAPHDAPPDALSQGDTLSRALAEFWVARSAEIARIVRRAEALGQALRQRQLPLVLCHTDIHTANVLIDGAGGLHVVDWDAPLFAPKERDLMFVTGSAQSAAHDAAQPATRTEAEQRFFSGYGNTGIDPVAFAYYRYEWVVQEIADYAERVLLMPDAGTETRRDALDGFRQLFRPGDVVDEAYRAEI